MQNVYQALAKAEEPSDNWGWFLIGLILILIIAFILSLFSDMSTSASVSTGLLLASLIGTVSVGEYNKHEKEKEERTQILESVYPDYLDSISNTSKSAVFVHSQSTHCDFRIVECMKASFTDSSNGTFYVNLPLEVYDTLDESKEYFIKYPELSIVDMDFIKEEELQRIVLNSPSISVPL